MARFSNLSRFLKEQRVRRNLTQAELAERLKMHSQFVSNWERGICSPPTNKIQDLIEILKINRQKMVSVMLADARAEISEMMSQTKSLEKISKQNR